MNDTQTTIQSLKNMVKEMVDERDWNQFHSPKNLSMNIAIEANELMEHFLWINEQESFKKLSHSDDRHAIEDELADVMIGICAFSNACNIDIAAAFIRKLQEVKAKYPADKVYGKSFKYDYYNKNEK